MSDQRPSRRQAAIMFAAVGVAAATVHVLWHDAGNLRLWREALPLAALVGALLGAVFRPCGWRVGGLVALAAIPIVALGYGTAETAILAGRGTITGAVGWIESIVFWVGVVLAKVAIGGITAILAGAAAGRWLGRG